MKSDLTKKGVLVDNSEGDAIKIAGKEYHEAPFDDRWDDLYGEIHEGTGGAALTYEGFRDVGFNMRFFRHNQNDNIFMTYQMPHCWNVSSSIYPHMHFVPMANGNGVAIFDYVYTWQDVGDLIPASSGWISGSISCSLSSSDQYTHMVRHFGPISPASSSFPRESSILFFKVERPGASNSSDTYQTGKDHGTAAANLGILFFDLHYQKNRAGTTSQFPEDPSHS